MSTNFISPFQYGKPLTHSLFVNREKEKKRIENNIQSGVNTILIAPRRWGKSSLVKETARIVGEKEKEIVFCFIDAFSIFSEEDFYETLARELIKSTSSKKEDWLNAGKDFFKSIVPRFSYGTDPAQDFSLSIDWKQAGKHKEEFLNLPETIANKIGIKIVVCIDEFQNISNFPDADTFEKLLQSQWQNHQNAIYCLSGSKRNTMGGIFNDKNRPFFRFGDIIFLEKIEKEHWVRHLVVYFSRTGKKIPQPLAEQITSLMKCHSYYVQQLAQIVWNLTDREVNDTILNYAIRELLHHNNAFCQLKIESISNTQINFLKAVLNGVTQFTSAAVMQDYRLGTPRNVSKNKDILRNNDFIDIRKGKAEFLDPAFELWFKEVYIKK